MLYLLTRFKKWKKKEIDQQSLASERKLPSPHSNFVECVIGTITSNNAGAKWEISRETSSHDRAAKKLKWKWTGSKTGTGRLTPRARSTLRSEHDSTTRDNSDESQLPNDIDKSFLWSFSLGR